jgi:hypothetical protein
MDERFDCRATAAVLKSGSSIALSGHAAALLCAVMKPGAWGPFVAWCALVYFAVRVELDARLFLLLAESPGSFDEWMAAAGLRKNALPRTLEDRRRGAMRLWRALLIALIVEIVLVIGALVWSPR